MPYGWNIYIYMTNELVICVICLLVRIFFLFLFLNSVWPCVSYCKDCDAKKQGDSACKNGHTIYGSLKGTCWWKVHQVSPVGIFATNRCFTIFFFKITVVKPFQENFEWSKPMICFFLVVFFLIDTFFGIMICVPLGLYFRSPPKKSKKVPFENYNGDPHVQSVREKKTLRRRRPRPRRRRRQRKRRAEELPRRLGFFHGWQTWDGWSAWEDGGSSMRLPRHRSYK